MIPTWIGNREKVIWRIRRRSGWPQRSRSTPRCRAEPPSSGRRGAAALLACAYFVLVLGVAGLLHFALAKIAPDWSFAARETSADTPDGHVTIIVAPIELSGPNAGWLLMDLLRSMVLDGLPVSMTTVVDFAHAPKVPRRREVRSQPAGAILGCGADRGAGPRTNRAAVIIWARGFEGRPCRRAATSASRNDLARQIATVIAQPRRGSSSLAWRMRSDLDGGLRCVIEAYDYWSSPTAGAHLKASYVSRAVAASRPNAVTALANLTYFYLDEYRVGYNPLPDPLDRALASARRAIELAPDSPRAIQALMAALFVRGNVDEALNLGRRALELNPFDTDIMADLGARLVQVGQYREGSNSSCRRPRRTQPIRPRLTLPLPGGLHAGRFPIPPGRRRPGSRRTSTFRG